MCNIVRPLTRRLQQTQQVRRYRFSPLRQTLHQMPVFLFFEDEAPTPRWSRPLVCDSMSPAQRLPDQDEPFYRLRVSPHAVSGPYRASRRPSTDTCCRSPLPQWSSRRRVFKTFFHPTCRLPLPRPHDPVMLSEAGVCQRVKTVAPGARGATMRGGVGGASLLADGTARRLVFRVPRPFLLFVSSRETSARHSGVTSAQSLRFRGCPSRPVMSAK